MVLLSRFFWAVSDRIQPAITFYGGINRYGGRADCDSQRAGSGMGRRATGLLGLGFSFPWSFDCVDGLRRTPSSERGSAVGVLSALYICLSG